MLFPVVMKSKILFWSPVDVFLYQSSYEQVSKMFCFTALCLSFQTWSYLLVQSEIPSRRLGSHPLSEHDSSCDETQSTKRQTVSNLVIILLIILARLSFFIT